MIFGHDESIEKIGFTQQLTPIDPIGKASITLTVLLGKCSKQWFDHNQWCIRCKEFPTSHAHFLHCLSNAIGAGIKP
jgi:hypothetical protein